ncbi:hypothetical protein ACFTXM_33150 [Streptomyces sp. NPDC056930]|uniref:hypothetical protein n=1 Tax=Streptomyces sp. NPDC056930 TaxID=3345967 RepID=UPI0036281B43
MACTTAFHADTGRLQVVPDAPVHGARPRPSQADVARLQFLGEHGEFDATAESFVFVDDEGDGDTRGADLPGELE